MMSIHISFIGSSRSGLGIEDESRNKDAISLAFAKLADTPFD